MKHMGDTRVHEVFSGSMPHFRKLSISVLNFKSAVKDRIVHDEVREYFGCDFGGFAG
jgi:hypothetical protein